MTNRTIHAVVFDLGGVLLELRDPVANFGVDMAAAEFLQRWLLSPSVREFERGAIDSETFARSVVSELSLAMEWREFLQRFDAWPERLFPGTLPLLDAIPAGISRGLLSNTNAAHWGRADISGRLAGRFDHEFLSYRTGLLKPDPESFAQVPERFGCAPAEILYFDDNPVNVTAAAGFGMQAHLAEGPNDALPVIREKCRRVRS